MPTTLDDDGSEDVTDFLKRIRELNEQRDKEDEERNRKLEEEIMQGRRERQARREERARSLSPMKDTSSNAGTPGSVRSRNDSLVMENTSKPPSIPLPAPQDPSIDDAPQKANGVSMRQESRETGEASRNSPQPPSKPQTLSHVSPNEAIAPPRAGTLSWQQRPPSRTSASSASRPSPSSIPITLPTSKAEPGSVASEDGIISRGKIPESLASKDPAWFKQTQERGLGSAALRKNRDEEGSGIRFQSVSIGLPGMSRESTSEPEKGPPTESVRSGSPSTVDSSHGGSGYGSTHKNSTLPSSLGSTNPSTPIIRSQKLDPSMPDTNSTVKDDKAGLGRDCAMSPTQGRLSPERVDRPSSPTKGLGGFVQSAMMKRSDSVSKRWSTQMAPGLSRGNSVANNRSGFEAPKYSLGGTATLGEPKPARFSRENTPAATSSRPSSTHSMSTVTPSQTSLIDENRLDRSEAAISSNGVRSHTPPESLPIKKPLPETTGQPSPPGIKQEPIMSPPTSPSKRWSPQKPSWLENAINKPESPKVLPPATTLQQPSWMVNISRAKQQRGSVDLSKGPTHKEIATGGLMRSPPPGTGSKPPNIGDFPTVSSTASSSQPRSGSSSDLSKGNDITESTASGNLPSSKSLGHLSMTSPIMSENHLATEDIPLDKDSTLGAKASGSIDAKSRSQFQGENPPMPKPKPDTPPKKDFRLTLKSRSNLGEAQRQQEPEFKNVFGNLKRAQTRNYNAPDELKENITRGKAGLTVTGGPKKTERRDEFKESILKKKQGMVAPTASTRISNTLKTNSESPAPEAVRKRQALNRSDDNASTFARDSSEHRISRDLGTSSRPQRPLEKPKMTTPEKPTAASTAIQKDINPSRAGDFASSLAGILKQGSSPMTNVLKTSDAPIRSSNEMHQLVDSGETDPKSRPGPQLTHATKNRARGPKRKLPSVVKRESSSSKYVQEIPSSSKTVHAGLGPTSGVSGKPPNNLTILSRSTPRPLQNITNNNNNNRKISQPTPPRKPSTSIKLQSKDSPTMSKPQSTEDSSKPVPAVISNSESRVDDAAQSLLVSPPRKIESTSNTIFNQDQKPSPSPPIFIERTPEEKQEQPIQSSSVKGAAALWSQQQHSKFPRSPIQLPTRRDEQAKIGEARLTAKHSTEATLDPSTNTPLPGSSKPSINDHVMSSPKSPPLPGKKPLHVANNTTSSNSRTTSTPNTTSFQPQHSDKARLLDEIFDESPSSKTDCRFDTQAVLEGRSIRDNFPKIKTLRKQIVEVIANGKTVPVPSHQEHILFEDSLYLCTHVFGTLAGQRMTEVYLWCGAGASPSLADDAQVFAKKVAKDNNGRLIILHHGQETSSFFQALGGIVITRRGSSSRADSSSGAYMLCGRQHVGQIAFDEVDYSSCSLCSSFPYIVLTTSGKIYLWKGKGASADELGCARLIGMDLGLTGEIEEIDEGQEPKTFWSEFAESGRPKPAQHQHLRASSENYMIRLFNIDSEIPRPKSASSFIQWGRRGSTPANEPHASTTAQIREITPFSHADLMNDSVLVLDAFFEIFVVHTLHSLSPPPHRRSTKVASFRTALLFAQEYGMLVASTEDRPFIPQAFAVFLTREGEECEVPEGLRQAFRQWDARRWSGCRILDLGEALQGIGASKGV